jgi:hypothetical protein
LTLTPIQLEISAFIQIGFLTKNEMYAVLRSLIPDNINFPKGLMVEMSPREHDNNLLLHLYSDVGFETLLSTVDEILAHISVAQKVISHA